MLRWPDRTDPGKRELAVVLTEQVEPIWLLDDWMQAIGT
jgi:hypothetical protein